ncbi:hypothetical protein ACFY2W_17995 [Streptomyces sp. NPDC001262]
MRLADELSGSRAEVMLSRDNFGLLAQHGIDSAGAERADRDWI